MANENLEDRADKVEKCPRCDRGLQAWSDVQDAAVPGVDVTDYLLCSCGYKKVVSGPYWQAC